MDDLSAPGKPSEAPSFIRPPGLEMAMGLALFTLCLAIFSVAQNAFHIANVVSTTPELAEQGFSLEMMGNDLFQRRFEELRSNGDAIAFVNFWSCLIGLICVLVVTWRWKSSRIRTFLALPLAPAREFVKWMVVFAALFGLLEVLQYFLPVAGNAFMTKVLGSSTNTVLILLGIGVMPALFEEFLFRGLLYGSLRHLLDHNIAIAITAGLFTMQHFQYEWYVMLVVVLPMSVALGYARANSGSIWVPVLLHMLNNCASILLPQFIR